MYRLASPAEHIGGDDDEMERRKRFASALGDAGKAAGDKLKAAAAEAPEGDAQLLSIAKKRVDSRQASRIRQSLIKPKF
jgi:hypothetical protein